MGFRPFAGGDWKPAGSNVTGFEPLSPLWTSALLQASWVVVAHAEGSRSTRTSCSRQTCLGLCCAVKQRRTVARSWVPWSGLQARSQCGVTAGVGEKLSPFGSSRRPHKLQGGGEFAKGRREHHPQGVSRLGLSPAPFVLVKYSWFSDREYGSRRPPCAQRLSQYIPLFQDKSLRAANVQIRRTVGHLSGP
jgi:hypothetical protein